MGISNAAEVIETTLERYSKALEVATKYSIDLENQSLSNISTLLMEKNIVDEDAESIFYYALQKQLCSENSINTVEDCQALLNLAKQGGATAEVLALLIRLQNSLNVIKSDSWGEATKELARKEQMLRSILDSMPIATYLKDLNGNITYENSKAKDFLGLSDSEFANKWDYENYRFDEIGKEDHEVLTTKSCIERDKQITLKNNDVRWFNITKCPIFDDKKNITGILCVTRDIELAKKAQDQRETYVATLTHDLKTPTIAQIKALDLLLSNTMGELNKEQKEMLILIKESCSYMHEMLSNLLSTYKYENGDYVLNFESLDIVELMDDVCQELESLLKEKNINIHVQIPEPIDKFKFDKIQIKRVFVNLLGNAITYAYSNTNIEIAIIKQESFVKIQITNYSPYINPSLLTNLFEKYVTHAAKYNKIGVGLGLYLSKQIVNAHNGEIRAISFEENKNIFEFTLPLNQE